MKNAMNRWGIFFLMMVMVITMVGCQSGAESEPAPKSTTLSYDGELAFTGLDESFTVAYNDIYGMETVTTEVDSVTSAGEENNNTVEGVLLETILNEHDLSQKDFATIRFIAGDGYGIDVTQDLLQEKDIILAFMFDGEQLDEKKMPIRVAMNDVRSMYFVSNLVEVQFIRTAKDNVEAADGPQKIMILETAMNGLEKAPYTYYDSEDQAIEVSQLFETYDVQEVGQVHFVASDGFEKSEDYGVLNEGYIKVDGVDSPLFTAPDLPKGMNVKSIMKLEVGNTVFASVEKALEVLENKTIEDNSGVSLKALIEMVGLEGNFYTFTAADGYSVEISKESLELGMIHLNNSGQYKLKFDQPLPKASGVKDILTIEVSDGSKALDAGIEMAPEPAAEGEGWVVTFEGLADGSFDFDQDRAERKLEKVSLHTERTKNDAKIPEDWEGYRVMDILSWLHVDTFESLTIIAQDGYEVMITSDLVDDETILADTKDGEMMTDDNKLQLVQNTEFSTSWVKGVVKIIVK
jgi:hypothetical protein